MIYIYNWLNIKKILYTCKESNLKFYVFNQSSSMNFDFFSKKNLCSYFSVELFRLEFYSRFVAVRCNTLYAIIFPLNLKVTCRPQKSKNNYNFTNFKIYTSRNQKRPLTHDKSNSNLQEKFLQIRTREHQVNINKKIA